MKLNKSQWIYFTLGIISLFVVGYAFGYEARIFGFRYLLTGLKYDRYLAACLIFIVLLICLLAHKIKSIDVKRSAKSFWERHKMKFLVFTFILAAGTGGGGGAENNQPRVHNVKMFGAKGDGITDDTQPIQAAINACNSAGGGTVFFPNGIYIIAGAINATYNSQLYIPFTAAGTATRNHITIRGESKPNFIPVGGGLSSGATLPLSTATVILKSTLATFTTGGQAVIGTAATSGFNETMLSVEDIAIQVKNNPAGAGPVVGGISYKNGGALQCNNVTVAVDTSAYRSTLPSNNVTGIELPDNGAESPNSLINTLVVGMRQGYKISEHVTLNHANAWCCYYGVYVKDATHASSGTWVETQWCPYDIYVIGPRCVFANWNLDTEWQQIGKWYDDVATIKDSTNSATGQIVYTVSAAGGSVDNSKFIKSGGTNLHTSPHAVGNASMTESFDGILENLVYNATNGTSAQARITLQSSTGSVSLGKYSPTKTTYKNLVASDAYLYNATSAGNFSFLNDYGGGNFNWAAGAASSPQMTLSSTGSLTVNSSGTSTVATFKNNSGSGNMVVNYNTGSNTNVNHVFQNNGANVWYMGNDGSAAGNFFRLINSDANGNSTRFKLTQAGILTLGAYGAGTATFDASGNISSVSDERLKNIQGFYKTGLNELMNIKPIFYKWNKKSGNEMHSTYAGFSAQNVKANIPYGTGQNKDGYLSLQDRAILATAINAIKEQQSQIEDLKKEIIKLKLKK